MIAVQRTSPPQILQKLGVRWLTTLRAATNDLAKVKNDPQSTKQDIRRAQRKKENAQNKYRHREIKNRLVEMFHGKCAYCESKITAITYGHIEHFYPKGTYVDKTFEWSNLLLACDICNDAGHKGTKFPLDSNATPLLIDPTDGITEPAEHLNFSWDAETYLASVYGRDERGQTVERIFDLNGVNGRKELIKHRSRYVKMLFACLKFAQLGNPEALAILQEACQADTQYSAFALEHIAPHIPEILKQSTDEASLSD